VRIGFNVLADGRRISRAWESRPVVKDEGAGGDHPLREREQSVVTR